ncbi:hypothetical protein I79_005197 [Cricetulus griseus]|uniref:Uncharacterized protein n=1 Tax=Cricetulus griseus TaxID=10029 RepID=G3H4J4_CRIGR|nr:hypothetical protein I79_005197 [Cricetulus griseus]
MSVGVHIYDLSTRLRIEAEGTEFNGSVGWTEVLPQNKTTPLREAYGYILLYF